MNWSVALNVIGTALVSGALTGLASYQQSGFAGPARQHVVIGAVACLTVLAAHLRQSPLPPR